MSFKFLNSTMQLRQCLEIILPLQTVLNVLFSPGKLSGYHVLTERWNAVRLLNTVDSLISGQSRDSISTVAPHGSFGLLNRIEWHNTVEIKSGDCPDMRDSNVFANSFLTVDIYGVYPLWEQLYLRTLSSTINRTSKYLFMTQNAYVDGYDGGYTWDF